MYRDRHAKSQYRNKRRGGGFRARKSQKVKFSRGGIRL